MLTRLSAVLGLLLVVIAGWYILFIELPVCSLTWGCGVTGASIDNYLVNSELPGVKLYPWEVSKQTFRKYVNASGLIYSDKYDKNTKTKITFAPMSGDEGGQLNVVRDGRGKVSLGIYEVDGGYEIRYRQDLLDNMKEAGGLYQELSFRIFYLFSGISNHGPEEIQAEYSKLPQLINPFRIVREANAECVGNYGCRSCESSCSCSVGGSSCANSGVACGPFLSGTCECIQTCDLPVAKPCSPFSQSLCEGTGGLCAPFEEVVYRNCSWYAPPASTPTPTVVGPTPPSGTNCATTCVTGYSNCGEVGMQGGDGSCAVGLCCKPLGGGLPPACDELRFTVDAASQTLYEGEQGTLRVDLYFRPDGSGISKIVNMTQGDPAAPPYRVAFDAGLSTFDWSSSWVSTPTSPATWFVPFWGKTAGTFRFSGTAIVDNGARASCPGLSNLINVLPALPVVSTINGYIFDASALSSCPATPTGLSGIPVTFTNLGSGATYTTTTNAAGFYQRTDLPAPTSYSITWNTAAYPTLLNTPAKFECQGSMSNVAVVAGQTYRRDAGLLAAQATINGYIFDASALSSCPATPTGFSGVPVTFINTSSWATYSTTTNAAGFYQKTDLPAPATYWIVYNTSGYPAMQNTPAKFECQGPMNSVTVAIGQTYRRDAGLLRAEAAISGYIFDASGISSCPVTPVTGYAGLPVTFTNSSGVTYTTTTNAAGFYQRTDLPAPATYWISWNTAAYPTVQNTPAKFYCDGAVNGVSVAAGNSYTRDVGLYQIRDSWWQARGGDVWGEGGVVTSIPDTCAGAENATSCGNYLQSGTYYTPMVGSNGTSDPGVALYNAGSVQLSGGGVAPANAVVSSNNWTAQTESQYDYDYAYYKRWIQRTVGLSMTAWDGVNKPADSDTTAYTSSGTLTWNHSLAAGENIFILHNGDVNITGNVTVPVGAYLSIVASGSINIQAAVTNVDGVYVAENINVQSTGNTSTEQQFVGNGSFIAWTNVSLGRDLGTGNATQPAERFNFRPDFVINAPRIMKLAKYVWTEVRP